MREQAYVMLTNETEDKPTFYELRSLWVENVQLMWSDTFIDKNLTLIEMKSILIRKKKLY